VIYVPTIESNAKHRVTAQRHYDCLDGQGETANDRIAAALASMGRSGTLMQGAEAVLAADPPVAGQPRDTDHNWPA
jgi:hypothetical protein